MKRIRTVVAVTSMLSLLVAAQSFAQLRSLSRDKGAEAHRASKIIGYDVENPQGQDLGKVEDIVIDPADGRIAYAVLSFGGFLGLGEKYFAIPWSALAPKTGDDKTYVLNVDKEKLKNAPGFDKTNWPDMANPNWATDIDRYYGVERTQRRAESRPSTTAERPVTVTERPATTAERERAAATVATQRPINKASDIIGYDVENLQGEDLGDIKDIMLDQASGRIAYAVLSFGGIAGLGDKLFAVPWSALTPKTGEANTFVLNVDKEKLKNAPGFDQNNWPDMANPRWTADIDRFYGVEHSTLSAGTMQRVGMPDEVMTVTVQDVNKNTGLLKLRVTSGETIEFKPSKELLDSLQVGDSVEVAIRKTAGGMPRRMDQPGATQPGATPKAR
jgi:sporulation protein YlmC with PRC-barrel domain